MNQGLKPLLLLLSVFLLMTGHASAAWYVDICPGGQRGLGLPAREGPFSDRASAQTYATSGNAQSDNCFTVSGSDDAAPGASTVPSSGDGMVDMARNLGTAIGQDIGHMLFPSAAEQQQEQLREQQQALLLQQEKDRIAAEQLRLANEKQAKIKSELKTMDGTSAPQPMGLKTVDNSGFASADDPSDDGFMQAPAKPQHHRSSQVYNQKAPVPTATAEQVAASPVTHVTPSAEHAPQGPDSHADLEVDGVHLVGYSLGTEKDAIRLTNTNTYAVSVNAFMTNGTKNCSHSLSSPTTLDPGQSVKIGWVGNTDGWGPWNYEMGMNVSKAGFQ